MDAEHRSSASLAITAALVLVGCYLGATVDTWLVFPGVGAAVLFPTYAIVTAALVRTPPRQWWVILAAATVGDFLPHQLGGASVAFVLLAEVVNHARVLIVAIALRRCSRSMRLDTMREMLVFVAVVGVVAPCVAGLGGAWLVTSSGSSDAFGLVWEEWSVSNAITGLTLLPILLVDRRDLAISRRRLAEAVGLAIALLAAGAYVFATARGPSPRLAWMLPFPLWAALRFGVRGTSAVVLATTVLATWATIEGRGPFATPEPADSLLGLQVFLIATSIPALLLAVSTAQQRRTALALGESRRQYRSVVEDQTEMICRFRPDGTCMFANRAFAEAFGRTPDELAGANLWSLVPAEARPDLARITPASPIATREASVATRDGPRWQQWRDRGLFDEAGNVVEYQAVGRDITDRKRAEDDRRELEARKWLEGTLRAADRRKDEFLAVLGHELRNPLAPIGLALQILLEAEPRSREAGWARESIKRQLGHMTRLVDDLLDISRITLGKTELHLESMDARSVVENAVEVSRSVLDSFGHALVVDLPPSPVLIRGDAVRLTQVVANLLNNAAKYTDRGGRIDIAVARHDRDVRISVRDNGIGLATESLETIFEPFAQISDPRGLQGLGIGLTLVRKLVELHGGRVAARSDGPRRGSEIVVHLPAFVRDAPALAPSPATAMGTRPLRILAVDDNIDIADGLAAVLNLWGHTVRTANDGVAALEVATAFAPEVVLLDIGLPRIDGIEVARRLREAHAPAPLVVSMSGFGLEPLRSRTDEAGFHDHLAKPIDLDSLRSLLDRARR